MAINGLRCALLALLIGGSVQAATVDLRIMETSDVHGNMMDYDYCKNTPREKFGLVRTASLIHAARAEVCADWAAKEVQVPVGHTLLPSSRRIARLILQRIGGMAELPTR